MNAAVVLRNGCRVAVENAAGATGRLWTHGDGRWFFERAGRPGEELPVWHDDLSFTLPDGSRRMLLAGVDGRFLSPESDEGLVAPLFVVIDADELACFYFPEDGEVPFLDHNPAVLGFLPADRPGA